MSIQSTESLYLPHPGPYLALVTNNLDPNFMGGLEVMLFEGTSPDLKNLRQDYTLSVKYLPSFWGYTSYQFEGNNSASFDDAQKSYGMWAVPPDIGTVVLCMFIGGDKNSGYWMGVVPDPSQNHMVPGLPATQFTAITPEQERKYGTRFLPTAEYNKKTRDLSNPKKDEYAKPIHPFADRLLAQGLLVDDIRGVTTSGARRERPSMVFGISTPGPVDKSVNAPKHPIGYKNNKLTAFTSRLGGHQIVMDDGDKNGLNELFRIRTRTGHQILLHNSSDLIYIANAAGTAWLEMTGNGKIDIYANDSISIHSEADFNFRADRDINIEALRDINISSGGNMKQKVQSDWSLDITREAKMAVGTVYNLKTQSAVVGVDTLELGAADRIVLNATNIIDLAATNVSAMGKDVLNLYSKALKMEGTVTAGLKAPNVRLSATGSFGIKGDTDIRLTSPSLNLNGAPAVSAPNAGKAISEVRVPAKPPSMPYYSLPNRDTDPGGWADGKFYKAEDIISIMKRVPTHEPYDQHENINKKVFSKEQTNLENDNRGKGEPAKYATVEYKVPTNTKGTPPTPTGDIEEDNVAAFLWMIRCCEGTSGPNGYQTLFTGAIFDPESPTFKAQNQWTQKYEGAKNRAYKWADHPRLVITVTHKNTKTGEVKPLPSTAAGAYQFLADTWDSCARTLKLPDFSPRSQDLACILLLKQTNSLTDVKKGRLSVALDKNKRIWASLPGDVYGQGGKNSAQALALYKQGGGTVVG